MSVPPPPAPMKFPGKKAAPKAPMLSPDDGGAESGGPAAVASAPPPPAAKGPKKVPATVAAQPSPSPSPAPHHATETTATTSEPATNAPPRGVVQNGSASQPTTAAAASNANSAAFAALQAAYSEQSERYQQLQHTVAELTRENNFLNERVASLLDCGLTPTSAQHSHEKGADGAAAAEVSYLKAKVRRLHAALQLEFAAREELEMKCAAQQASLAQVIASSQTKRRD